MTDVDPTKSGSPWHAGERAMQEELGVAARMESIGSKLIRDQMSPQHRAFFEQLPFVVIGAVDVAGTPWVTMVEGLPGFVRSPDPRTLRVGALPRDGDPVRRAIAGGAGVAVLGIELATRRRNRANGRVSARDEAGFTIAVEQSFGNCPQYIQERDLVFARDPSAAFEAPIDLGTSLDAASRAQIAAADTFFVASYVDSSGDRARRAVDVSHRGGEAGFVRIDGDVLTIPDFSGNRFFTTLGNLRVNPRAGLLFPDFATGDLLHVAGEAELVLDGDEIGAFQGAERLWRVKVEQVIRRRAALALRGAAADP